MQLGFSLPVGALGLCCLAMQARGRPPTGPWRTRPQHQQHQHARAWSHRTKMAMTTQQSRPPSALAAATTTAMVHVLLHRRFVNSFATLVPQFMPWQPPDMRQ